MASINAIKRKLVDATNFPNLFVNAPTQLVTDVSDTPFGTVIQQTVYDVIRPIAFSRNLTTAQKKWSTFDQELLAIFFCCEALQVLFLIADHSPLLLVVSFCFS